MKKTFMNVKIANATVSVPMCEDEETTRQIARMVSDRIQAIEENAIRIDSHAFALRAAYEFAAALHDAKKDQQADEQQIATALDAIATKLQNLADEYAIQK